MGDIPCVGEVWAPKHPDNHGANCQKVVIDNMNVYGHIDTPVMRYVGLDGHRYLDTIVHFMSWYKKLDG